MFFLPGEAGIFPASSDGALDPPTKWRIQLASAAEAEARRSSSKRV